MIYAKLEAMSELPLYCTICDLQDVNGWCLALPGDKQDSPVVANHELVEKAMYKGTDGQTHIDKYKCGRRKNCPLRKSFREIYAECIGMKTSTTETFERESRC